MPFSATQFSFTRRPAASAAFTPISTRGSAPQRVIARNFSASSVSSETLTRFTPQAAISAA